VRVLLDEHLDKRLKRYFSKDFEVFHVHDQGWSGVQNGKLLALAAEQFDAFITMDKGIRHQQNIEALNLRIVLLLAVSNRLVETSALIEQVQASLLAMPIGELRTVRQ
jgi:predicted nuclease of predicted toxin-antitoxin system